MNQFRTFLLLAALTGLLIAVGGALGPMYLYGLTALALVLNVGTYYFSDRVVLAMHHARELPASRGVSIRRTVAELAGAACVPAPRVFLIPGAQPNAFATGRNPSRGVVAVTEGLLSTLSERELRGVLAHEIAHIRNRDILVASVAATVAAAVAYIAQAGQFAAWFGIGRRDEEDGGGLGTLLWLIVAPVAATLVQLGISRSREYLADETAAGLTGDPGGLASALERLHVMSRELPTTGHPATASLFIVNPLGGRSLVNLFSTHPPADERVRRLRALGTVVRSPASRTLPGEAR